MQSNVALDPHGNPLLEDEEEFLDGDVALESGNLGEREGLTSNLDDEDPDDEVDLRDRVSTNTFDYHNPLTFSAGCERG